jgi:hypothetical protein
LPVLSFSLCIFYWYQYCVDQTFYFVLLLPLLCLCRVFFSVTSTVSLSLFFLPLPLWRRYHFLFCVTVATIVSLSVFFCCCLYCVVVTFLSYYFVDVSVASMSVCFFVVVCFAVASIVSLSGFLLLLLSLLSRFHSVYFTDVTIASLSFFILFYCCLYCVVVVFLFLFLLFSILRRCHFLFCFVLALLWRCRFFVVAVASTVSFSLCIFY